MKRCPVCGKELEKVIQSNNSYLNHYQFDAIKAGDYFCRNCKGTRGKTGFRYYWEKEISEKKLLIELGQSLWWIFMLIISCISWIFYFTFTNLHKLFFCTWTKNQEHNRYNTACKHEHTFFRGNPAQNDYRFCQFCGKRIKKI